MATTASGNSPMNPPEGLVFPLSIVPQDASNDIAQTKSQAKLFIKCVSPKFLEGWVILL